MLLQKDKSLAKNLIVLYWHNYIGMNLLCNFRYGWIIRTCLSMFCAWCCTSLSWAWTTKSKTTRRTRFDRSPLGRSCCHYSLCTPTLTGFYWFQEPCIEEHCHDSWFPGTNLLSNLHHVINFVRVRVPETAPEVKREAPPSTSNEASSYGQVTKNSPVKSEPWNAQ